ncbi:MAG: AtpZ/AtpI family protein [Hyphomicrobiales bacterium]|jgi:ATP synthase protein I|nr:AtpZ/AtpI family protein [Hyphomicrobiales bacterium]|tara:strand:- start:1379 stop:1687 length:309 start_codon:yes stop_codon:yes gene_type:complete
MDKQKKKLEEISTKINKYKSNHKITKTHQREKRGKQISIAMRLSTELVVACVVGGVLGWYIDKWLNTKPIFFLILLILGVISGIKTAINTSRQLYENDSKSE